MVHQRRRVLQSHRPQIRTRCLCLLDLPDDAQSKAAIASGDYTVMIEGEPVAAEVSVQPFYDPLNERMLS